MANQFYSIFLTLSFIISFLYFGLGDTNLMSRLTGGRLQILGSVGRNDNNNNPGIGKYMLNSKNSVTIKEVPRPWGLIS